MICDRCHLPIDGAVPELTTPEEIRSYRGMTGGYYITLGTWKRFADHGEHIVCDNCMWNDPRYQAVYERNKN